MHGTYDRQQLATWNKLRAEYIIFFYDCDLLFQNIFYGFSAAKMLEQMPQHAQD